MRKKGNLKAGERFGRGVVIAKNEEFSARAKKTYYDMMCDCGTKYYTTYSALINGYSRSCGCLRKELTRERFKGGRKRTFFITYNGETRTIMEWAEITGINARTLRSRYCTLGIRGEKLFCPVNLQNGKEITKQH